MGKVSKALHQHYKNLQKMENFKLCSLVNELLNSSVYSSRKTKCLLIIFNIAFCNSGSLRSYTMLGFLITLFSSSFSCGQKVSVVHFVQRKILYGHSMHWKRKLKKFGNGVKKIFYFPQPSLQQLYFPTSLGSDLECRPLPLF